MPDIRYVCLSDLHLGAKNSLLTNIKPGSDDRDLTCPGPVLSQLALCLRDLIGQNEGQTKPTLILNGDIYELALSEDNEAVMAFERFIEALFPDNQEPIFDGLIYIPGNHDHHLWETARENQYIGYIVESKPTAYLKRPWHTTKIFAEKETITQSHSLTREIIRRYPHLRKLTVSVVYPNLGLLSEDGWRCVLITHGHYIESIYLLMSEWRSLAFPNETAPTHVWNIEAENFAWIDFFWSTLGRSSLVGEDIDLVYDMLQDRRALNRLFETFAASVFNKPAFLRALKVKGLAWLLSLTLGGLAKHERQVSRQVLSPASQKGLSKYVEGPLYLGVMEERSQTMPSEVSLIFGHTHKPFNAIMEFTGYPEHVKVYNTGGWVVDTEHIQGLHGGAVVLIDEHLDNVLLRMYNEHDKSGEYKIKVEHASYPGMKENPFYQRITRLVDPKSDPWTAFSSVVAEEVTRRRKLLRKEIKKG